MLATTKRAITATVTAIFESDPTISPAERRGIISRLVADTPATPETTDRLIRRGEVAKRLAVCTRSVDNYVTRGILKPVKLPGQSRNSGFRESDIIALIGVNGEG